VSTADMPRPGQAHVVITQESIAAVNSLVRDYVWTVCVTQILSPMYHSSIYNIYVHLN